MSSCKFERYHQAYGGECWPVGKDGIGLLDGGRMVLSLSAACAASSVDSSIFARLSLLSTIACSDGALCDCSTSRAASAKAAARLISFEMLLVRGLIPFAKPARPAEDVDPSFFSTRSLLAAAEPRVPSSSLPVPICGCEFCRFLTTSPCGSGSMGIKGDVRLEGLLTGLPISSRLGVIERRGCPRRPTRLRIAALRDAEGVLNADDP